MRRRLTTRQLDNDKYSVYNSAMRSRDVIRRLLRDGWVLARSKGSHRQYKHPARSGLVVVPHPRSHLPIGTLRSIFKQAGWSDLP